jgi:hypothetical protein
MQRASLLRQVAEHYFAFSEQFSLDPQKHNETLRLSVLLSLRAVDRRRVFDDADVSCFVDWDLVNKHPAQCTYTPTPALWVHVVRSFDADLFADELADELADECHLIPPLLTTFNQQLAEAGLQLPFAQVALLFLLLNVNGMVIDVAATCFLNVVSPDTPQLSRSVKKFCVSQADSRADRQDYEAALAFILRRVRVRGAFTEDLAAFVKRNASVKALAAQRHEAVWSGRPRLRDFLSKREREMAQVQSATPDSISQLSADSFNGWCIRVRFPNAMSFPLRQKLYLLMCQRQDFSEYVGTLVDAEVAKAVLREKISSPQVDVLKGIVARLNFFEAPFRELQLFRVAVGKGLALSTHSSLTYSALMQMYIAAYQRPAVWQEVWQHVQPTLTHTIISSVTDFVQTNAFNVEMFKLALDSSL